ncbi:hypothetical protein [Nonomuraea sp. NPDC048916]|uniref:hypothetical protein n=1 Tax=Nonomuraea sp. NPDC048916 TaxID=3154232 RepID=UPI0033D3A8C5
MLLRAPHRLAAVTACFLWAIPACSAGTATTTATAVQDAPPRSAEAPGPGPAIERRHATYLRPGDCLLDLPRDLVATVVPCGHPHAAEYASIYVLPEGSWPGVEKATRRALEWCAPRLRVKASKREAVEAGALPPLEHEWPGERTAYCLAVPRKGDLVGRVLE